MNMCEFHTHTDRGGIFLFTTVSQYGTSSFLCSIEKLGVVAIGMSTLAGV